MWLSCGYSSLLSFSLMFLPCLRSSGLLINLISRFLQPEAWKICLQADNSLMKGCLTWIRLSLLVFFFQNCFSSSSLRYLWLILLILKNVFQDRDPLFRTMQSWNLFSPTLNLTLVALLIMALLCSADHSTRFEFLNVLQNCFTL